MSPRPLFQPMAGRCGRSSSPLSPMRRGVGRPCSEVSPAMNGRIGAVKSLGDDVRRCVIAGTTRYATDPPVPRYDRREAPCPLGRRPACRGQTSPSCRRRTHRSPAGRGHRRAIVVLLATTQLRGPPTLPPQAQAAYDLLDLGQVGCGQARGGWPPRANAIQHGPRLSPPRHVDKDARH